MKLGMIFDISSCNLELTVYNILKHGKRGTWLNILVLQAAHHLLVGLPLNVLLQRWPQPVLKRVRLVPQKGGLYSQQRCQHFDQQQNSQNSRREVPKRTHASLQPWTGTHFPYSDHLSLWGAISNSDEIQRDQTLGNRLDLASGVRAENNWMIVEFILWTLIYNFE